MKIKPINDRVLVLRAEQEQKTAGGIIFMREDDILGVWE
jgi:co-chaperonin GroES (HSP10)